MFTGVVIGFICFHLSEALQCYNCGSLLDPNSCHHHVTCATNQMCRSSRSPNANNQYIYSFGCLEKMVCQAISSTNVIGRRSLLASLTTCCETDLCNKSPLIGTTLPSTSMVTIDPNFCADYPGLKCDNVLVCTVSSTANLCKKTCGLCSGGNSPKTSTSESPFVGTPRPGTSAVTPDLRTTITAGVCSDYPGVMCDNRLVCTVSSTASLCRKTCGLCSGASSLITSTSVPTVATCKSHDPIPECQCKYLDKQTDICTASETDQRLKAFCCYYCNRKKGFQRCPDATCDRIEKHEHAIVDALTTGIACTH